MPEHLRSNTSEQFSEGRPASSGFSDAEVRFVTWLVGHSIADLERELIRETLVRFHGSRTRAATALAISIRTLRNKIKTYKDCGMDMPEPRQTVHLLDKPPDAAAVSLDIGE